MKVCTAVYYNEGSPGGGGGPLDDGRRTLEEHLTTAYKLLVQGGASWEEEEDGNDVMHVNDDEIGTSQTVQTKVSSYWTESNQCFQLPKGPRALLTE